MKFVGIDPSFNRTGVCIYDEDTGEVVFHRIDGTPGEVDRSFPGVYRGAKKVSGQLMNIIKPIGECQIVIEFPPPVSQYSAGMYALCVTICNDLEREGYHLRVAHPSIGRYLFKIKPWHKSDSVRVATPFWKQAGRLCADEADAFVMLLAAVPDLAAKCKVINPVKLISLEDK